MLEGLENAARGIALDENERIALGLLSSDAFAGTRLFIVPATANVLRRFYGARAEVQTLEKRAETIVPGRYWRRWARRLQAVGFTREDARVLSLATFGTDMQESFLGVDELLTFDKTLATLLDEKRALIQGQLDAFRREVTPPYDAARLPAVVLLGQRLENKSRETRGEQGAHNARERGV
jgi:hypothetical protein